LYFIGIYQIDTYNFTISYPLAGKSHENPQNAAGPHLYDEDFNLLAAKPLPSIRQMLKTTIMQHFESS
jgi:hypothetical protein